MKQSEEYLAELVERFRPEAAQGLEAVYELRLTGEGGGTWHMVVGDQRCKLLSGAAPKASTIISLSSQDWQALIAGRMDAFTAMLEGKLTIQGDMNLATRLPGLFGM